MTKTYKSPHRPARVAGTDGKKRHPMVELARRHKLTDLARYLGHANHSTVAIYVGRAKKDVTHPVPHEWVIPIAKLTGWKPAALRPDLYLDEWEVPASMGKTLPGKLPEGLALRRVTQVQP